MKLLYLLLPLVSACSPELMIYDAKQCKGAVSRMGITTFKEYRTANAKFPSGCSIQTAHHRKIAQFVPGVDSVGKCSTTADPTPFKCVCKQLPEIRKTLVNKHRKR